MSSSSEPPSGAPPALPPGLKRVIAPLLLGSLFNWALYGVLCVQTYVYSYNFPNDRLSVKILAYSVFVVETIQTGLNGADIHYWFVDGFGDPERLGHSHYSPVDIALVITVTSFAVQSYFCYQIWTLSRRSLWLCFIIALSSLAQAGGGLWLSISTLKTGRYVESKSAIFMWSIPAAIADILIAVSMVLLLRRAIGKLPQFILLRTVRLTIETNTVTAAVAIVSLILYSAFPDQLYYAYMSEIIGKMYSNTLFVSLNNRIYLRDHQSTIGDSTSFPAPSMTRATGATSIQFAGTGTTMTRSGVATTDSMQLSTIPQAVELEKSKGDDTTSSVNWSIPHARKTHPLPDDPESTLESFHPTQSE